MSGARHYIHHTFAAAFDTFELRKRVAETIDDEWYCPCEALSVPVTDRLIKVSKYWFWRPTQLPHTIPLN